MQHVSVNSQAQIPLPATCWQPKGCLLRALLPGTSKRQYIDSTLATTATGRLGSIKSWIAQCNSSTSKPLLHYILECCHLHQRFGHRIDVEVEGMLTEVVKLVNKAFKDKVSIIALLGAHPVP